MADAASDTHYYKSKAVAHHEWRTVANSAQYIVPTLQSLVAHNPKLQLLDIGAGSGTISADLATYIPQGHVLATDVSSEILSNAAAHAKRKGVQNISFQTTSVYELPFPDSTFDVVHASQVIAHLTDPIKAIREMLRVTKPGGVVADRESDLRMWCAYPEPDGFSELQQIYLETIRARGGDPTAAGKLVSWAMKAGASRERIMSSFGTWTYSTLEDRRVWGGTMAAGLRRGEQYDKALAMGFVTEELEHWAQSWDQWIETEEATFGALQGEILIRK